MDAYKRFYLLSVDTSGTASYRQCMHGSHFSRTYVYRIDGHVLGVLQSLRMEGSNCSEFQNEGGSNLSELSK